jgi:nicotinamide-nucleotide amidase
MRCEVVAVGTELLLGQIVDTNSAWIGDRLASAGIDSFFQTKVGDNIERLTATLRQALGRSDAVVVCGGLGPTQDDLTRSALARVMGVELVRDPDLVEVIRAMFASRSRRMPANNLAQADVPEGATIIEQTRGTAPGLICPVRWEGPDGEPVEKVLYAVPGVPYEMQDMLERAVLPDLRHRAGDTGAIVSRTLRTWGDSESGLAERLAARIDELDRTPTATIAFLASGIEGIKVRVTAKAATEREATAAVDAEETLLRDLLGDLVFGVDEETMEHAVVSLLAAAGLTLGIAESLTGGLIGARITNVPGASRVFRGGIVSYASEVKFDLLDVPEGPVVRAATVEAMAVGARRVLGADIGLAVTGVAGPDWQDGERPGTVFIGLAIGDDVTSQLVVLPGDRERVRQFATISAVDALRHRLLAEARAAT